MATKDQALTAGDVAGIYRACPLERGSRNDIRVLNILPSASPDGSDTIACRMRVISVASTTFYNAVSYVWGGSNKTKTITVDGVALTVRINIWNFLWQMRSEGHEGLFWIDALCIHQQDVLERSHQVRLMGQIYAQARMVIVWLGTEDDNQAVRFSLRLLGEKSEDLIRATASWHEVQWAALESFCNAEYWSRLWIVQEFTLAQQLQIRCGRIVLAGHVLKAFEVALRRRIGDYKPLSTLWEDSVYFRGLQDMYRSATMGLIRQQHRYQATSIKDDDFLIEMICLFAHSKCSDPRDHVYGLLALAESTISITPDYSKSSAEIFQDVFDLLKTMHDVSRKKVLIVLNLRTIGSALGLTAGDPIVKSTFEELGVECFLEDDDGSEHHG